ncbi:hypothetical protein [Tuwongella immobilis]|uniref:Uncharacterized protein n=1 Tax=Tuwongella immobilis TaxID=692036 RepID=A0A6C2YIH9_9BACT|nr:hypothetical protein [Tuwongella immobilis]VIP01348.1 Uncharacterized protein OS=Planctomyces limnophilus (strain ATCC 43296 / DSM 3776 / IFAM 1008 / 290) GN=Plim_1360 PE=4 SV=1 [Tuwongella immobilis]VTR98137.1 Uncharacterized protein OS=Planctomyces limnophilus (strain ATCC 43296 / DSM 3776 / IFAM 1008 / 290) GN=Plim_1360 PE=4 SV=1 [Tuwongella immobilis]
MNNRNHSNSESSSPISWKQGSFLALGLVGVLAIWWPGCREYPPVSHPDGIRLIQQLYSACNSRDATRLARAEATLTQAIAKGHVTVTERKSFEAILQQAKAGQWDAAAAASLKFAQDQVGAGSSATRPAEHSHAHHHAKS